LQTWTWAGHQGWGLGEKRKESGSCGTDWNEAAAHTALIQAILQGLREGGGNAQERVGRPFEMGNLRREGPTTRIHSEVQNCVSRGGLDRGSKTIGPFGGGWGGGGGGGVAQDGELQPCKKKEPRHRSTLRRLKAGALSVHKEEKME